ncbi:hypothetical protein FRC16_002665 [Serendipita sp. 398]|nr:hypothetical protein FRC16_002665 [Serendipita sp. 398]
MFEHFLLRARTVAFYRSVIRASRHIPGVDARKGTVQWIRGEIEQASDMTEVDRIEQHLSYLQRLMKQVLPGFHLAAQKKSRKLENDLGLHDSTYRYDISI